MKCKLERAAFVLAVLSAVLAPLSLAQSDSAYKQALIASSDPIANFSDAVSRAVLVSPNVNGNWYNLQASGAAQRSARGSYYPSVDVASQWGREERETPLVDFGDYNTDSTRFSITQMLFDGFATRDEVARLGYAKLSRYYEFKRASEEVALEATRVYLSTLRFQQLVSYARQNLKFHRQIYDMVAERTGGGISQGVDLDQVSARVSLAESNLVTEASNLHDLKMRFQSVVGVLPANNLQFPSVPSSMIPQLRNSALELAYQQSPELNASIENLRSAQEALNATNAPMMPRLDLRYRNEIENDVDGFEGRYDEQAIEVVISYNLFRGGSDSARKREFYYLYNVAIEERKQACLNVRQNVMIAFNDVRALEKQVILLDQNLFSQDKTRRAYRDQFDIGQRSLLDLLDSQNEFFDIQRGYVSARVDLLAAQARTLSNMGLLLAAMDMDGLTSDNIDELNLDFKRDPNDPNARHYCPLEDSPDLGIDTDALLVTARNGATAVAALAAGNERYRDVGDNKLSLELNVLFGFDSSLITDSDDDEIARTADLLLANPTVRVVIEGHTCDRGAPSYNQWLSERRANAVRDLMIEQHNVEPSQISAVGYGQNRPVATNDNEFNREKNRRVELVVEAGGF